MKGAVFLTDRSLNDLADIYEYTLRKWGENQADEYLLKIQHSLSILEANPDLLIRNSKVSDRFCLYLVEKHWLVCDSTNDSIFILTIRHTSMNLLDRLKDLEPTLEEEAQILMRQIQKNF